MTSDQPSEAMSQPAHDSRASAKEPMQVNQQGDPRREYEACLREAAICDLCDRGLVEVTGKDRAAWLHNLTTNAIKTLRPGEGNYCFVLNVKGRILFDCNVVILSDRVWVDVDRRYLAKAMTHFERYHITEDVQMADRSQAYSRIAVVGRRAADVASALGATQAGNMASLGSTSVVVADKPRLMVRNDFAGLPGLEFYIESADAVGCREHLERVGGAPLHSVGPTALEVLRIEAGLPRYGQDIDEDVLPAETGQSERGVSYVKGCYLGQEIVERMRSRGGLAHKLVGLKLSGAVGPQPGSVLQIEGVEVGRLTSLCYSYAVDGPVALGYVKTAHAATGTRLTVDSTGVDAEVAPLPFRK